ncbi:hypothetical protein J4477_01805 [Candidatus Pacearchaeota archaeon]|nr:hypothetical protein [Candidatus Pacearchaeota archaeon]
MAQKNLSGLAERCFLAFALTSGCVMTSNYENIPEEVRDVVDITQGVVDRSFRESIEEAKNEGYFSEAELEKKIENVYGNHLDRIMFWDGSVWPREDVPGIDSLDYRTNLFRVEVDVNEGKVSAGVSLPTIIRKDGKIYRINEYKFSEDL